MKKVISTDKAPGAVGPYSQAIRAGDFLFISGQIGIDPATGKMEDGGIEEQARRVLLNLESILEEAGLDSGSVVKCTVFLKSIEDFGKVNEIYGVKGESEVKLRQSGPFKMIECRIQTSPTLPLYHAHELADKTEDFIIRNYDNIESVFGVLPEVINIEVPSLVFFLR